MNTDTGINSDSEKNTNTESQNFLDTNSARIVAIGCAVVFGLLIWYNSGSEPEIAQVPQPGSEVLNTLNSNPALQECLENRVRDVDQMKSDGIISDTQYESFRANAEELCRQRYTN